MAMFNSYLEFPEGKWVYSSLYFQLWWTGPSLHPGAELSGAPGSSRAATSARAEKRPAGRQPMK